MVEDTTQEKYGKKKKSEKVRKNRCNLKHCTLYRHLFCRSCRCLMAESETQVELLEIFCYLQLIITAEMMTMMYFHMMYSDLYI